MLRHSVVFLVLCLSLTTSAATMAIDGRSVDKRTATRIDADVQTILQRTGTLGASILIAKHGHIIYRHAYGLGDREGRRPATVDTEYEIGYLPNAPHAGEVTLGAAAQRGAGQETVPATWHAPRRSSGFSTTSYSRAGTELIA